MFCAWLCRRYSLTTAAIRGGRRARAGPTPTSAAGVAPSSVLREIFRLSIGLPFPCPFSPRQEGLLRLSKLLVLHDGDAATPRPILPPLLGKDGAEHRRDG